MTFTDTEVKQILGWENINADEYLRKSQLKEKNSTHYRVKQMHSMYVYMYRESPPISN